MRRIVQIAMLAPVLLAAAQEFEVASIKTNPPQSGFHLAADAVSDDPGMFRCTRCSLATLIVKAFNLQPYQFPGRTSLTENTYDIQAKIPAGATAEDFSAMLQNLLKARFGLTWHFQEKKMKGYHLVVAKDGPKLTESGAADQHRAAQTESHNHSGVIAFGSSASFRASNQTTTDLARVLSDQLGLPVDDATGLSSKYDISLRWSGAAAAPHAHSDDGGHGGRDGGALPADGPTIFDALQQQLGLKLAPAEQTNTRIFIVDRAASRPTEN